MFLTSKITTHVLWIFAEFTNKYLDLCRSTAGEKPTIVMRENPFKVSSELYDKYDKYFKKLEEIKKKFITTDLFKKLSVIRTGRSIQFIYLIELKLCGI